VSRSSFSKLALVAAEETFQKLVAQLDYPMFIATVATDAERAGCLIGFATQCSINPPRFLAGISDKNHTYRVARGATAMGIHLVPEHATELAELFGGETGDEFDKFERCSWRAGPEGVPLIDDCPNRFVGRILERVDFGDHTGMVLEPFFAEFDEPEGQLGFHRAKRIDPGHEA
jgi:flavin reductase (DIM6/NTAB) family NADH-FMN oxidoreductase RutF